MFDFAPCWLLHCSPEQLQKPRGTVLGDTEKTKTDKDRERRRKKTLKKTAAREKDKAQKLIAKLKVGIPVDACLS